MASHPPADTELRDRFGRAVRFLNLPSLAPVEPQLCPPAHFAVFVAADARVAQSATLLAFAESFVRVGCVYALCWGEECEHMEEAFDYADVYLHEGGDETDVVMTTSHPDEPLEEALLFATRDACPAEQYVRSCKHLLVVLVGATASEAQVRAFFAGPLSAS